MAGVRSWEETLRRLADEDPCADSLLALERWLEMRPGYAITFGKAEQPDGSRLTACAITMPGGAQYQFSSGEGLNAALTLAMTAIARVEAAILLRKSAKAEQLKPCGALNVRELLEWTIRGGKPAT